MRVAITGATGLFGHGLVAAFSTRHEVFPLTRAEADITDAEAIGAALERIRPDLVVHPAGIPDLDVCDADPALAMRVNYQGTCNVAEAARRVGAGLAHISTDAVFDGKSVTPYVETDPTAPITVYGRTKLQAEQAVETLERYWIFRVSVLFGPGKTNFVEKGLRKIASRRGVQGCQRTVGFCDSHGGCRDEDYGGGGGPADTAFTTWRIRERATRFELARKAAELAGLDPAKVIGVPDALMQRRAPRLKYAVMEMAALRRAGFALPRPWQEALTDYIHTLKL